ncbi:polysaccharide biosynthesis/export family protein [Chthonobacter rhizosphaerae]|uniref:polysaccharide biosynthesis/export family protein n=1 Tax=Chthonobacter rhizosphaerae TaxID=2735553 RepID=UPI0015EF6A3E|nr:polysaccharide biosynthesis/export family protein [Chthonobacter rhizosphaerae]
MRFRKDLVRVSGVALALAIGGCSTLPRSGPAHQAVEKGASQRVTTPGNKVGIDYVLVDINKSVLPYVTAATKSSLADGFGMGRGSAPALPLGVGDIVQVSIFEAGSGGLFIPADAGSRPGNFITLPSQRVDSTGTITVPYAGRVPAAGRTVATVQTDIENTLANRAIEPQVLITVEQSRSAEVAVLGDVNSPAKLELNPAGERLLDVISRAGGLSTPGIETYITLERRGRTATVLFDDVVNNANENIYVLPGDTIYVDRERRTYLAFGATGVSGRFDFEESDLTLGEALGKAGGLLDNQADPAEVLLYRLVPRREVAQYGGDVTKFHDDQIPVVFRANLRDPSAFFAVQRFPMQDSDLIYVSNAESVELTKFLTIVNNVSTTASGVPQDINDARNAIRAIGD